MPRRYPKRSGKARRKNRKRSYKKKSYKKKGKPSGTTQIRYEKDIFDQVESAAVNSKTYATHLIGTRTSLQALIDQYDAVFFDEAANTVTAKFLANTAYSLAAPIAAIHGLKMYVKKMTLTMTLRNNYQLPCDIDLAWFNTKMTTASTAVALLKLDLDDQNIPHSTAVSAPLYGWKQRNPAGRFNRHYGMKWSKKYRILPGQEITVVGVAPPMWIKSETLINETAAYQRKHCWGFMMAISGILGHESDASDLGFLPAKVDLLIQRDFQWCFPQNLQRDIKMVNTQTLGATSLEVALPRDPVQETVPDIT